MNIIDDMKGLGIKFGDGFIGGDPPVLATDFYPIGSGVFFRMIIVFMEDKRYVSVIPDYYPWLSTLAPDTEIDPTLWSNAMLSIDREFDDHCKRYGIPYKSVLGSR